MIYLNENDILIREMREPDPQIFSDEEIKQGWHASPDKYKMRIADQEKGDCLALTAEYKGAPAGYINVYWNPPAGAFANRNIPEIVDFGVLEKYRCRGIGRRLMDPLAELVKIDPKSIGVGQYQHDVDQTKLKKALDQTVENCVNLVGVNLNTASSHLLTYISGLGPQLAQNIVNYRAENGAFGSRKELMKVPRMGAKAFEQCAGFLRIPGAKNPLDNTAVHPESYHIVEQMAKDLKCTIDELIADKELRRKINISAYITPTVGLPTLQDILQELDKPGRDPRKAIKVFEFDKNVRTIADLREGMILPGIVGNITNFGAFVDIGIKENGLVHLSQLAERFISDPTEVVSIHQHVMVRVMNVDYDRKRIQLSMIGVQQD